MDPGSRAGPRDGKGLKGWASFLHLCPPWLGSLPTSQRVQEEGHVGHPRLGSGRIPLPLLCYPERRACKGPGGRKVSPGIQYPFEFSPHLYGGGGSSGHNQGVWQRIRGSPSDPFCLPVQGREANGLDPNLGLFRKFCSRLGPQPPPTPLLKGTPGIKSSQSHNWAVGRPGLQSGTGIRQSSIFLCKQGQAHYCRLAGPGTKD